MTGAIETGVPPGLRFRGHAIVSADGMIAAADGSMPPALRNDADWARFQAALDDIVLVVVGRLGHAAHPSRSRRRLVLTSGVAALAADPNDRNALLFNPAGASLAAALEAAGVAAGTVAVTGGTRVFDYFLPVLGSFHLAEVNGLAMRGGRACFSAGHPRAVLAAAGFLPKGFETIDAKAGVTLTDWQRAKSKNQEGSTRWWV